MFQAKTSLSTTGRAQKITLFQEDKLLSYREVIDLWISSREFRAFYNQTLADCPFEGICWETPPVTRNNIDRDFECMLINEPRFTRLQPDEASFSEHFDAYPDASVLTFPNLGHNAMLVVPTPEADPHTYTHLANFVRQAPESQRDELWMQVGLAMEDRLGYRPVWLSTAGMGVFWLHIRLDDRPKYYRYHEYKNERLS